MPSPVTPSEVTLPCPHAQGCPLCPPALGPPSPPRAHVLWDRDPLGGTGGHWFGLQRLDESGQRGGGSWGHLGQLGTGRGGTKGVGGPAVSPRPREKEGKRGKKRKLARNQSGELVKLGWRSRCHRAATGRAGRAGDTGGSRPPRGQDPAAVSVCLPLCPVRSLRVCPEGSGGCLVPPGGCGAGAAVGLVSVCLSVPARGAHPAAAGASAGTRTAASVCLSVCPVLRLLAQGGHGLSVRPSQGM